MSDSDKALTWRLASAVARRELRGGLAGFRIFLFCLILGVTAIAAIGSMSSGLVAGLTAQGRAILGGDVDISLIHRPAEKKARDWMAAQGRVAPIATMRAMVLSDARSVLVDLKAVGNAYPLVGALATAPPQNMMAALAVRDGAYGVLVERELLQRLGLTLGDRARLGAITIMFRGIITHEPDRAANSFGTGPRVMLSFAALKASQLEQPGSLITYHYRIRLPDPASNADIAALARAVPQIFPDVGFRVRDRSDAAPSLRRFILRVGLFLTLVGLTALVVGGVGVGNGVRAYLDSRRDTIAILKSLGGTGGFVVRVYLIQILALASFAICVGLVLGAALPWLATLFFADMLPIMPQTALYAPPLLAAAGFGLLIALAFALWPLGRARAIPPAQLFRDRLAPAGAPMHRYLIGIAACFVGLVGIAVFIADRPIIALWFVLGLLAAYAALRVTGDFIMGAARRAPHGSPELRMALRNIYRPDAPTRAVVLSMGLAVALLSTITMVDGNIAAQIKGELPERAPSFFMLDIQPDQIADIRARAEATQGFYGLEESPMLRGKLMAVNDVVAENLTPAPEVEWVLRGDRGLTYESRPPQGTEIVAGKWWPPDYVGPPLLSIDADIARGLGIKLGDTVTMNVLGRGLTARVANLRRIDWSSGGINFVVIFSPEPLRHAPHRFLVTVQMAAAREAAFRREIANAFPNVTIIRVKDVIERINALLRDFGLAVRVMSVLTLLAGIFVLAGAMASGHRARVYDAVVMKTLGATRRRILLAYILEYALIGAGAALIAAMAGTLASWGLIRFAMQAEWVFLPMTLIATVGGATLLTVLLGLAGTYRALGAPSAQILRTQ